MLDLNKKAVSIETAFGFFLNVYCAMVCLRISSRRLPARRRASVLSSALPGLL